ncbi:MAG: FtsK/SpoIIIE domain-containing protein, partial [Eubacteriales bacterium]
FYLQVGNNELFEMGQSSWAGAPYYPSAKVIKDRDDGVSVINTNGRIIAEANVDRFAMFKNPKKQLDVVTDHIDKVCQKEQITRWKMWLDPIPSEIYLDALIAKYRVQPGGGFVLNPLVGEYDHPAAQCQDALHVPLSKDGNVVIYGSAGSGKVMFLESMCCSLIQNHTPEQVNLYILDFGAETMSVFAKAPHVGDVILSHETEKVDNIFKLLIGRMGTRKKLLAGLGLDMSAYNQQAEKPEANMVVVINNYAAFFELYENHMADLSFLTREGTKYGIYFVLACTGVNNVRFQLLQNFKTMYCLQLNNADDYSSVVGKTEGLFPENHSGRGLLRKDKSTVVEFQVAQPNSKVPTYQAIQDLCHRAKERHSNFHAKKVPVLPEEVTLEFLQDTVSTRQLSGVPAGVNKATLAVAAYDLTASPIHLVLSDDREWETFLNRWAQLLTQGYTQNLMVFAPYAAAHPQDNLQVYSSMDECVTGVRQVFATVLTRNNTYKEALKNHQPLPTFEPLVVIIQSMTQLKALLDSYAQVDTTEKEAADDTPWTRLQLSMSKCEKTYNVHFIVGESIQTLTPLTAEPWYKTHIRGNQGIWIGGGISNQYRLSITKKPTNFTADLDAPFGYVVENGTAILTKFLQ